MSARRVFVALALGEEAGGRLAAAVGPTLATVREDFPATAAGDLHATLFFLGQVDDGVVAALAERLPPALEGLPAPRLEITGTGAFPAPGRERVLWAGLSGELDRLVRIQAAVEQVAGGLGFRPEDRPFTPHVTVARRRRGARARVPEAFTALDPRIGWQPGEVAIVESLAGRPGARPDRLYERLEGTPLARESP